MAKFDAVLRAKGRSRTIDPQFLALADKTKRQEAFTSWLDDRYSVFRAVKSAKGGIAPDWSDLSGFAEDSLGLEARNFRLQVRGTSTSFVVPLGALELDQFYEKLGSREQRVLLSYMSDVESRENQALSNLFEKPGVETRFRLAQSQFQIGSVLQDIAVGYRAGAEASKEVAIEFIDEKGVKISDVSGLRAHYTFYDSRTDEECISESDFGATSMKVIYGTHRFWSSNTDGKVGNDRAKFKTADQNKVVIRIPN